MGSLLSVYRMGSGYLMPWPMIWCKKVTCGGGLQSFPFRKYGKFPSWWNSWIGSSFNWSIGYPLPSLLASGDPQMAPIGLQEPLRHPWGSHGLCFRALDIILELQWQMSVQLSLLETIGVFRYPVSSWEWIEILWYLLGLFNNNKGPLEILGVL